MLLKTPKHKNFWDIDEIEQSKLKKKFTSIKASKLETKQLSTYDEILGNWYRSHGNNHSNRFSNLKKINKQNIDKLKLAWIYNSNNGSGAKIDIQCNPIVIDGIIYTPVVGGYIVAINGFDGQEIWRSEKFNHDVARRGLVFWEDKNSKKERIFFNGSKLVALNTKSGLKDKSFGKME